jgi:Glycosyl transferase family 11
MLIIKLFGGLGNQMFQYAFGRKLALKNDVPLFLDTFSGFRDDFYKRTYSLGIFNIQANSLDSKTVEKINRLQQPTGRKDRLFNALNQYLLGFNPLIVNEKHYQYDEQVLNTNTQFAYMSGYWQSEKYFEDVEKTIRKDFTFKTPLSANLLALANEIQGKNSVCFHLRRLHGLADGKVNNEGVTFHGSSGMAYYAKAIEILAEKEKNLHFYIFSDSPAWAKENVKLSFPTTFMEGNKDDEDLQLMSLCKHHIIANSSFSWWSAWLNANPAKIVCAPDEWFADKSVNTKDIYPSSWIRI